ncbi:carboxypeptidase regulatory-like domain-containing protein [Candidatus Accumulibacter sp. ACC007]|uniref:carboxypeptidase regulatory-like domain-containing protein n=1 Tax=Candidatus Accumulibacter sp. ACC007 TaxID=2823333 RepID=UPI0025B94092|nr:carboxypeptidase regulatory-like domain-containing protein [Candidatus Accumulibacter sp. ACC007]
MQGFQDLLAKFLGASLLSLGVVCAAGAAVPYVSGGIGDDDPIEVEAMRNEYNLQLVFVEKGSGAYLADVKVRIQDAAGQTVLDAYSPGPLFFVSLRPGHYRVDAEYNGGVLSKTASVGEGRRRELYFYWPHE